MKTNLVDLISKVILSEAYKQNSDAPSHIDRFQIRCNLCNRSFSSHSRHIRFCEKCRVTDEIYRYAEWLPDASSQ